MTIVFSDATFRDDYRFRNSQCAVDRFPFPFDRDDYMYTVNIEPHDAGPAGAITAYPVDIDEHYVAEMADRAITLAQDPGRCQSLPHMISAEWDLLELLMVSMAEHYPEHFSLQCDGNNWRWINRPLAIDQHFVFGDAATLPYGPMEYICRQCQGDFALLDQRDNNLWLDAGMITSQADWSLDFNIGMNFMQWHAPVPLAHEAGVFERALKFLLSLRQGAPVRRLNWTMTVNPRLDTSPETWNRWGIEKTSITDANVGEKLCLRVELQGMWRLPRSNAVLFSIRCYLIRLDELATQPKWARRLHRVLRDLPQPIAAYKGLEAYRDIAVAWLARRDDGAPTSPGRKPD